MAEDLVTVENLGKKFCRSLKRSLWYGLRDIGSEIIGSRRRHVGLRKEEFWALKNISFKITRGELLGLIGPNGAGKTTILKLLTGILRPDRGHIAISGKIQALIALGAGFNPVLTGRENVYINAAILGFSKSEINGMIDNIVDFSEIGEFIDMPVQSYSSGMQVRLGFAVAVNLKPDILIVDEVLAVGDASFRRKARHKMMELLHSGISVLFVSHNMATINSLTSRCIYLHRGEIAAIGPSEEITTLYLRDAAAENGEKSEETAASYMNAAYVALPDTFVLKKVGIYDFSGNETRDFHINEPIRLVFEIEVKERLGALSFGLAIRTQLDDLVIGTSKMTPQLTDPAGNVKIECVINNNRLREGVYNVGFYAADPEGGTLFKSNQVDSFTILADMAKIAVFGSSRGLVVMDTEWSVL